MTHSYILRNQYHFCWSPDGARSHGINSHSIDIDLLGCYGLCLKCKYVRLYKYSRAKIINDLMHLLTVHAHIHHNGHYVWMQGHIYCCKPMCCTLSMYLSIHSSNQPVNQPSNHPMMTSSSNGNIFRVPGYLCGEFTGPRWISRTKASDAELWCFLWSASE